MNQKQAGIWTYIEQCIYSYMTDLGNLANLCDLHETWCEMCALSKGMLFHTGASLQIWLLTPLCDLSSDETVSQSSAIV